MPSIYLASDFLCRYSEEDAGAIEAHRWMLHRTSRNGRYYAYAFVFVIDPETQEIQRKKIYMHRLVVGFPVGLLVDHDDRDGLNNRRWNLRVTTGTFNGANADYGQNLCGYRGVSRSHPRTRTFRARITFHGEEINVGSFPTARAAAEAYDAKALELYGEFAWLNFDMERHRAKARDIEREIARVRELEEIPF